jgi:hypothetical protein
MAVNMLSLLSTLEGDLQSFSLGSRMEEVDEVRRKGLMGPEGKISTGSEWSFGVWRTGSESVSISIHHFIMMTQ